LCGDNLTYHVTPHNLLLKIYYSKYNIIFHHSKSINLLHKPFRTPCILLSHTSNSYCKGLVVDPQKDATKIILLLTHFQIVLTLQQFVFNHPACARDDEDDDSIDSNDSNPNKEPDDMNAELVDKGDAAAYMTPSRKRSPR
jgi:hypothetical protein